MTSSFETQLEALVREYSEGAARSIHDDASDVFSETDIHDLQTRCFAAVQRAAGANSVYYTRLLEIGKRNSHVYYHVAGQIGVVKSLLSDIRNGYLRSLEEIVHGDLFGNYLEMADHLCVNGYKDAGAVVAGSTLEIHLRQLCIKHGVSSEVSGKPKKADLLNADLVKSDVYTKLDQKNVTAWLGLRNDATHGNYGAYEATQVKLMISGVRDFITRIRA